MTSVDNRPLRVFLCHSSADKPAVRELYQKLRTEPWIEPWLDEEELYPGQDWETEIEKAVESSDVVLVCLSNGSINKRGFVQKELRFALDIAFEMPEETIFIVPLRLEECTPPRSLRDWQYVDYFPKPQHERALQKLIVSLKTRASSLGLRNQTTISKENKKETAIEIPKSAQSEMPTAEWIAKNKIILSNGMEFMRIPAGKFLMGSTYHQLDDERPQHIIDIPYDYLMARYPVTFDLYRTLIGAEVKYRGYDVEGEKDHPVVLVKWTDTIKYCQLLNHLFKTELPVGLVLRLPTEAEWEKAARGTDGREYPWGNQFDKYKCNIGRRATTPVGLYSPKGDSPYGCADMTGNVEEWTNSLKKAYPYNINDGRENEKVLGDRVLRSSSFGSDMWIARCASRSFSRMDFVNIHVGFRICIAPPLPK
ncbi:MAG: SUMF1/EgtB/PvdO family nonheme iron enzyme [Chloroflexi bacterium]|nr:SUMF1/EgtB/PvdO family nonheme iron enzyme [Chloroflexota bacterium]